MFSHTSTWNLEDYSKALYDKLSDEAKDLSWFLQNGVCSSSAHEPQKLGGNQGTAVHIKVGKSEISPMLAVLKEVYNPDTPNGDLPMGRQTYFIPNALLEEADVGAQGMDAYRRDIALQTFITSRMGYCCSNNILDAIHHRIGGDGPNFIEAASLLVAKSLNHLHIH